MASLSCTFETFSNKGCDTSKRFPGVTENFPLTSWPKIPDVAPAKRQRLSHISETNIRFTKKCMERKNIIEDRIISGVPVTFPKLESVRRNNRDPML